MSQALRRRERANHDGSVTPVRQVPEAGHSNGKSNDNGSAVEVANDQNLKQKDKVVRLCTILETLNEASISLLEKNIRTMQSVFFRANENIHSTAVFKTRWSEFDKQAEGIRSLSYLAEGPDSDAPAVFLARLRDTSCYGHWMKAWALCKKWIDEKKSRLPEVDNVASLWQEAVHAFDDLWGSNQQTVLGAEFSVPALLKIRSVEPVIFRILDIPGWDLDVPNCDAVTRGLRAKAEEVAKMRHRMRMEELRRPDLVTLIADQSTLTTAVSIAIFCCAALLGVAWNYRDPDVGSYQDMDFWFTIQSSVMSLLGFFTTMFPLYRRSWGSPWRWSLVFCGVGATSCLTAIAAYVALPGFWSPGLSFLGTASQAIITLQLSLLAMQPAARGKQD